MGLPWRTPRFLAALLTLLVLLAPPVAAGDSGPGDGGGDDDDEDDDDERIELVQAGRCSGGANWRLRLRAEDGWIRIDFEIDESRIGSLWRVVVVHERQIVLQGTRRTIRPSASFEVRRVVEDWYGADHVVARATGPRGATCRAAVTI